MAFRPLAAVGLAFAGLIMTVGLRWPAATAAFGLLLLAIGPPVTIGETIGAYETEPIRKAVLILCFAPAVVRYRFDPRLLLPLAAYAALGALGLVFSDRPMGLTGAQMVESLITLTLGWSILAIRWPRASAPSMMHALALLPLASVLVGGVLAVVGIGLVYDVGFGGVPRLGGATIPPQLAFLAVVGISAAILSARMFKSRAGTALAVLNGLILALTVSRGSMAAGLIVAIPSALRFVRSARPGTGIRKELRAIMLALMVVVAAAAIAPAVLARSSSYTEAGQLNTSGRSNAWEYFWDQAQQSPVWGRGLGSGPVIEVPEYIERGDFTAQHNEYLRMFLEGGYVGFALVLFALAFTLREVSRRFPSRVSADLWALVIAFALLSFVDNTLSAPEFAVSFLLLLGLARAMGPDEHPAPPPAHRADSTRSVPV